MTSNAPRVGERSVIAVALTWDGARWPTRKLSPKARAFLEGKSRRMVASPSARKTAQLLAGDEIGEIRVCWVPRLKGGSGVLCEPFATRSGKRIGFKPVRMVRIGELLGVVYRRD